VLCTVHDDGDGFDPASAPAGMGLELSVRRRVEGVGGSVTIRSAPGRGTDVEMTVP
jgi:signal transduction histidine kinase